MDEQEIYEHRYRFFSEKGVSITVEHDKILATLFTGIIAGLIALVVYGKVGFFSGVMFIIAAGMAVMGLAYCLLHMSFTSKVMLLLAAQFGGEESVPNVLEKEEPTMTALARTRDHAQRCYSGQLMHLLLAVVAAGMGLAFELWKFVLVSGLVIALTLLVVLALISGFVIWRKSKAPERQK